MSAIAATKTQYFDKIKYVWAAVTENDTFVAVEPPGLNMDRSVQVEGTFGSATLAVNGSNDGTNYRPFTDPQGNAVSKTSAGVEQLIEALSYIKPSASGGTAQSLTVTLVVSRKP